MNMEALRDDYFEEGQRIDEQKLAKLIKVLQVTERSEDILKVLDDEEYRRKLMQEFNL